MFITNNGEDLGFFQVSKNINLENNEIDFEKPDIELLNKIYNSISKYKNYNSKKYYFDKNKKIYKYNKRKEKNYRFLSKNFNKKN